MVLAVKGVSVTPGIDPGLLCNIDLSGRHARCNSSPVLLTINIRQRSVINRLFVHTGGMTGKTCRSKNHSTCLHRGVFH